MMKYEKFSIAVLRGGWWADDQEIDLWEEWGSLLGAYYGNMVSLDLNCQQMKHLGIEAKEGNSFVNSYVKSLVLLDKGVDAGIASYANHANDSSSSMHHSKGESEMA
ncbi:hypothetical protein PTKIN_Ptkin14bG0108900 [Pterospermum kingtungense]